jgi:diguanylate cyclase (GGDEF)-like protein
MVVDDEPPMLELLEYVLSRAGCEVLSASSGPAALAVLEQALPHLVVADINMPEMTGFELCRRVRRTPGFELVPFVFLSARGQRFEHAAAVEEGADDYIAKPFERDELVSRVQTVLRRAQAYQRATHVDALTEIGDREHFDQRLREELYRQQRYGISSSLALVAIDVGALEAVDPAQGSAGLDQVLRFVGHFLRDNVRALDVPARYSENGFIVLMPHTSRDRAMIAITRLSEQLNAQELQLSGQPVDVNASFGVAIVDRELDDISEMIQRAHTSMIRARQHGDHRPVVWTDETESDEDNHG